MKRTWIVLSIFLAVVLLIGAQVLSQAQTTQPVLRIGVLDDERGAVANGARLAVREINQSGGVTSAQGTTYRLELVIEPHSPRSRLEESLLRFAEADVDVVLGPETTEAITNALPLLQNLGVPILTPATGDLVVASDTTRSVFRTRASQRQMGAALADYLVVRSAVRDIVTVQLDQSSFGEHIGFLNALTRQTEPLNRSVLRYNANHGISALTDEIMVREPQAVVTFGPPLLAARFYTQLREAGWVGIFAYNDATVPAFNRNVPFEELHGIVSAVTWSPDTATSRSRGFVTRYLEGYDAVPGAVEASSYDAVYLLAEAARRPGDLRTNLSDVRDFVGVQGVLNPTGLADREMSDTSAVIQLNALGGTDLRLRYASGEPIDPDEEDEQTPTPTPLPTATPQGVSITIMSAVQNVRTGPGLNYPVIGQMRQGETATLIGASIDYTWVVINFRGTQGWLATYLLDVSGDLRTLPVIPAPPLPTPTMTPIPSPTPAPIYIGIQSPQSGNIVAGNVPVFGSALHPQFLQYQLEFAPMPNPQNIWLPINIAQTPVVSGLIGIWNTTVLQDGLYQLRLNVTLRSGIVLSALVSNVHVQNTAPTPVPTATQVVAPPVASFTPDRTTGTTPLTVQFSNQSTGTISSYRWNFGDGATSAETHPTHTFSAPGIYTVTLEATGAGGTSNFSWQINVTSANAPVAGFSMSTASGAAPLTVQFTDQSSGNITSWLWNFSDGTTSTERSPSHTFTNVGTYNVFLTVTGPGGTSVARRQVVVQNPVVPPPTALFSATPSSGVTPLIVQFNNQSTGSITSYTWNFGDGSISSETNPVHTYSAPGSYTVTLYASGAGGSSTAQLTVVVNAPAATATQVPPTEPPALPLELTNTPTDTAIPAADTLVPPTATLTLTATPTETPVPPTATFTETPTETPVPPTATFTETATETLVPPTETPTETPTFTPISPTETFTLTFTPTPVPPVAAFIAAVTDDPMTYQFTSQSTGEIASVAWNFGDGTTSNEANPVHMYAAPGDYTVTLTVMGVDGVTSDTTSQTISIAAPTATPEPVTAAFSAAPVEGVPLTIQFTNQSTGPVASYLWDFGDGTIDADPDPVHTYAALGDYTVTLIVAAADGVTMDDSVQTVTVAPEATPEPTLEPTIATPVTLPLFTLGADAGEVNDAAWSPDAARIAAANGDGTITLWDALTGQAAGTLTGHATEALTLDWSPDGLLLASGSADGQILIWDVNSQQPIVTAQAADAVTDVAWTAGGTVIAAASADGSVSLVDAAGALTPLTQAEDAVNALAWGANDATLLLGVNDGSIILLDIATGQPLYTQNATSAVRSLAWRFDGAQFVTGFEDGSIVIWDAANGLGVLPPFVLSNEAITAVAWHPDGTQIMTGDALGVLTLLDAVTGAVVQSIEAHTDAVTAVEWNNIGTQHLSASDDGTVLIWQP